MRIRSIKPEFWRSDDVAQLAWDERLLFIGLWSYVDDNGVGIDRLASIVADLFSGDVEADPHETFARVSRGLQRLSEANLIARYKVGGKRYLYVTGWAKHQRVDRPNKERYPLPTCEDAESVTEAATPSRESRETPSSGTGEQGNRGTVSLLPARAGETDPERFEEFWDAYDKKTGRKKAEAKYRLAIKKRGVTEELLIEAAKRYIAGQRRANKHPEFTKDPTTWLNGEHWTDETVAPKREMTNYEAANAGEWWRW